MKTPKNGKWRGKSVSQYTKYKKSKRKSKAVLDKMVSKITYQKIKEK